jgi:(2Fe-2S) ferredoxin
LDPHNIVGCLLYVSENLNWYEQMSSGLNYDEVADVIFQMHINNENEEEVELKKLVLSKCLSIKRYSLALLIDIL